MGFISAIRPVLPTTDLSSHSQTGSSAGSAPASQTGASQGGSRASSAVVTEIAEPVALASGAGSTRPPLTDQSNLSELARARVEQAQRAYMMTLRAVGVNPLVNRVP